MAKQSINDLKHGYISGVISESQFPMTAVEESINVNFDKMGSARTRRGTTLLGTAGVLSGNLLGLYEFRDSGAGVNNQIIAVNGTVVYYLSGTTWTSKRTTLTSGSKARFTTFLDFVFMVNGTEATAIWDGNPSNSFITTGNAASAPTGTFIENYRSRVWIAGNSSKPDRVYYSSVPSAIATPIITWSTDDTTGDWIDISPMDGENITGLKRAKGALLVFKNNHLYRIFSVNQADPDPQINIGTYSQESIVEAENGIYFHHPTGIFIYSDGAIKRISKPIQDVIDNITLANYSKVCGWNNGDYVYFSVGNITMNGITYSNVVVRYTISSQVWTIYSYPTQFLVSSNYNDSSVLYKLAGDNGGSVLKTDTGNTDNTTPINFSLITRPYTFDGVFYTKKTISKMAFHHKNAQGSSLTWQADDDEVNTWKDLASVSWYVSKPFTTNIKGNKIKFRWSGTSSGEPMEFISLDPIEIGGNLEI